MASSSKEGDDFWNTSSSFSFNFDDDEEVKTSPDVFSYASQERSALPVHSIISKKGLERILASSQPQIGNVLTPEEVVKGLFLGQNVSFEPYKSLSAKICILDAAIQLRDGNVLLKVLSFIKSTLEQSIFHQILSTRKPAIFQYASELMFNEDTSSLSNFYMVTGCYRFTPEIYMVCPANPQQSLLEYTMSPSSGLKNSFDPLRIKFLSLRWQSQNNIKTKTVIEMLVQYANSLIEKKKLSIELLYEFKRLFNMDDMSFEWAIMNVLASKEMWPQISDFFMKPNWFNKRTVLKLTLPPDKFVYGISRHGPSKEILEYFLGAISDGERAVNLAIKLKCHKFVIQYYVNQKDKSALINYRTCVNPQSEDSFLLENALQSLERKWKKEKIQM